jgi:hypothetical protein
MGSVQKSTALFVKCEEWRSRAGRDCGVSALASIHSALLSILNNSNARGSTFTIRLEIRQLNML